jgi:hypothetical protein
MFCFVLFCVSTESSAMSHKDDDQLKSLSSHAVVVAEVQTTSYSKDDDDCDVVETEPKDIVAEVETANNKDGKVAKILPSSTDDDGHEITSKYNRDDDEAKLPKSSTAEEEEEEEDVVVTEAETTNDSVAKLPSYTDHGNDTATGPVKPKKAPKKFKKGKNTTSRIPPPPHLYSSQHLTLIDLPYEQNTTIITMV